MQQRVSHGVEPGFHDAEIAIQDGALRRGFHGLGIRPPRVFEASLVGRPLGCGDQIPHASELDDFDAPTQIRQPGINLQRRLETGQRQFTLAAGEVAFGPASVCGRVAGGRADGVVEPRHGLFDLLLGQQDVAEPDLRRDVARRASDQRAVLVARAAEVAALEESPRPSMLIGQSLVAALVWRSRIDVVDVQRR